MHEAEPPRTIVFQSDEMNLLRVAPDWTMDDLLAQEGIFFLKDVVGLLDIRAADATKLALNNPDIAWSVYGIRKLWNHWAVRMKVFSNTYREHLAPPYKSVPEDWDGNSLATAEGVYLLSHICALIPFTTFQIRYQANKLEDAREEMGVWKHERINRFVVSFPTFANWLRTTWEGEFQKD